MDFCCFFNSKAKQNQTQAVQGQGLHRVGKWAAHIPSTCHSTRVRDEALHTLLMCAPECLQASCKGPRGDEEAGNAEVPCPLSSWSKASTLVLPALIWILIILGLSCFFCCDEDTLQKVCLNSQCWWPRLETVTLHPQSRLQ